MKKTKNKAAEHEQYARGTTPRARALTVLHIDDDPNDAELFEAAVRRANAPFSVRNVTDAEQAMAYLSGAGKYANRRLYPLPALVLLDLKMPRATGFDVLKWIRNHPEVGSLPVVIFSGSELEDDIQRAYASGADSYLVKPIGFSALIDLVRTINDSWVQTSAGPSSSLSIASRAATWSESSSWVRDQGSSEARA